jgi:nucleoid-associated protein YgaU
MPNDAKLALVVGVGLVVVVAIVFFHKDIVASPSADGKPPASVGSPPAGAPDAPASGQRTVPARRTARTVEATAARKHTVVEGDTLYGLAERYYGDGELFVELYQSNRAVLKRPDRLEVGTVLIIPDLSDGPAVTEPRADDR